MARPDDVVMIAGKGHEKYQQTGNEKKYFDDRQEARQALKNYA
jgi:UDP-N-acetylmuramoyl-L-alanyl-D-glutamate--2,6-diaminopimelate ligase